jgi:hypothetical protein
MISGFVVALFLLLSDFSEVQTSAVTRLWLLTDVGPPEVYLPMAGG